MLLQLEYKVFDIPYIVNRVERLLGEEQVRLISPWKIVKVVK
nr:MAG: hypothetical protein CM15mV30_0630 [uncultured marine virus]